MDVKAICDEYNNQLIFPAGKCFSTNIKKIKFNWILYFCLYIILTDDPRLCYSIREQICVGVWPNPKGFDSHGFCRSMLIKSRCMDASKSFWSNSSNDWIRWFTLLTQWTLEYSNKLVGKYSKTSSSVRIVDSVFGLVVSDVWSKFKIVM